MKKINLFTLRLAYFLIFLYVFADISRNCIRIFSYPTYLGNFLVKKTSCLLNWNVQHRVRCFSDTLSFLEPPLVYRIIWPLPLFGYDHLFDRVIFRITHSDMNGSEYEPYKYFDEDGSKADNFILNERFLLSCWKFMEFFVTNRSELETLEEEIIAIVKHSKKFLPEIIDYNYSSVYIKFLHQPTSYKGNFKPWASQCFMKFCDIKNGKFILHECKNLFDINSLDNDVFQNKIIVRSEKY